MYLNKRNRVGRIVGLLSLTVVIFTVVTQLTSCNMSTRYSRYDRTGERYDYDLTEYISIPEYKNIEIPDIYYTASEQEIEDNKYKKLAYFASEEIIEDGTAEKYDLVVADYICKIDGIEYANLCSSVNESYRNFMVGINYFMIPEIDEAVLGMAPGETKKIEFVFPRPYYKDPSVSGLKAEFEITVEKIRRQNFPEFSDEFVSEYFGAEDAESYTSEIKTQLEHDIETALEDYEADITWEYIVSNAKLKKIPGKEFADMNDYETSYYISLAKSENMSLSEYAVEKLGYDSVNDLYDAISEYSEDAVKNEMIIYIIARCENITVSEDEYNDALLDAGSSYEVTDIETCKEIVVKNYGSEERYKSLLLAEKVYGYISDSAIKIDADEYYTNKDAGKYVVDPDETSGPSKTEVMITVVFCISVLLFVGVVILLVKAVREKRKNTALRTERQKLEEKRERRRVARASKKKNYTKSGKGDNSQNKSEDVIGNNDLKD